MIAKGPCASPLCKIAKQTRNIHGHLKIYCDEMKQLEYHNTLAASMLIILFSEILKLSQKNSKSKIW
jgi:hypothetical protein